jgi:hypothetical protein
MMILWIPSTLTIPVEIISHRSALGRELGHKKIACMHDFP